MAVTYHIDPATPEEIDWIAHLESEAYSEENAVPKPILKAWYDANPDGFSIIRMNGQKIGHIDILPLRPSALDQFHNGEIVERDITGNGLYLPAERSSIRNLYIESLIIQPSREHSNVRPLAVLHLLINFILVVSRICNPDDVEQVCAIVASESGKQLMQRLGFHQAKRGQDRLDGHDLYAAKFVDLAAAISKFSGRRFRGRRKAELVKQ